MPAEVGAQLDFTTLRLTKESFVDDALKAQQSDLLFQIQTHGGTPVRLYLLLEHKSYPDPWVALQILGYLVRIWEQEKQRRKQPPLPIVIPLVLYHGEPVYDAGGTEYAQGITWARVGVWRGGYWYEGWAAAAYLGGHTNPGGPAVSGLKVTAGGLNLRGGPGLGYWIHRIVPYGTVLQSAGGQVWDGYRWWTPVSINGTTLWAASQYLQAV